MSGRRARAIRRRVDAYAKSVRRPGDPAASPQGLKSIARRARRDYARGVFR